MAKTKAKKKKSSSSTRPAAAPEVPLVNTLESLLDQSQTSAERLAELLKQTRQVQSEIADAGLALEQRVREVLDLLPAVNPARAKDLSARTEQLEAARAVAEAADQAKSCFLAAMSRELRTPVEGLARMIELLQQTELDDEQGRYLRTANHSICALLSLLDSVLSLSKVDAAVADLRTADFNLPQVLKQTVELLQPVARKQGLRIKVNVRSEVPTILRGDAGRLQQVLLYAVRRAIQLAAHGEISIRANAEEATESTTMLRITVGHGDTEIAKQDLQEAFAPQLHINGPTTGGRGLGLTIARQIVELMGGRIEVERNPTRGFAIWFAIPLDNYRRLVDDRRAHGRLPQELLHSNLGPVLDLSMGGVRVQCTRAPKGEVDVELMDIEEPVHIKAEVMWTRKLGFRKYEVGLNFPHVEPDVARQLTRVSLNHRLRRLLGMG